MFYTKYLKIYFDIIEVDLIFHRPWSKFDLTTKSNYLGSDTIVWPKNKNSMYHPKQTKIRKMW
jgi:hypothetical protein